MKPPCAPRLDLGISRVVIGTRAAESMDFVARLVKTFGSEKVIVGIDARGGEVAVKGWTESAGRQAIDLAREAEAAGVGGIIYTDIATDGMLAGPNFAELDFLLAPPRLPAHRQRRRHHGRRRAAARLTAGLVRSDHRPGDL